MGKRPLCLCSLFRSTWYHWQYTQGMELFCKYPRVGPRGCDQIKRRARIPVLLPPFTPSSSRGSAQNLKSRNAIISPHRAHRIGQSGSSVQPGIFQQSLIVLRVCYLHFSGFSSQAGSYPLVVNESDLYPTISSRYHKDMTVACV